MSGKILLTLFLLIQPVAFCELSTFEYIDSKYVVKTNSTKVYPLSYKSYFNIETKVEYKYPFYNQYNPSYSINNYIVRCSDSPTIALYSVKYFKNNKLIKYWGKNATPYMYYILYTPQDILTNNLTNYVCTMRAL